MNGVLLALSAILPFLSPTSPPKYAEYRTDPRQQVTTPPVQPQTPIPQVPPRVVVPPPPADPNRRPLTSEEAVRIALAQAPVLSVAQAQILGAQGRATQVRAGLRPTFGLDTSFSYTESLSRQGAAGGNTGGNVGGGNVGNDPTLGVFGGGATFYRANLTANQLLYDFDRTRNLVRQNDALARAFQRDLTRTQQDLAFEVRTRFANLDANGRLVAVAEANVTNRTSQLTLAQARLDSGLGAPADVVRARTGLADAVSGLVVSRLDQDASRALLAQSLGIDPRTPIDPAPETAIVPDAGDLNGLVETALVRRPELAGDRERIAAAGFGLASARRTNAPRLSASLGLNGRGANDPFGTPAAVFGLVISWPFGDGGLTRGRVQEAQANQNVAEGNLRINVQSVVSEVAQAYLGVAAGVQRLTIADVGLANATELVRLAEGRYAGGVGTFLEITDAQTSLVTAGRVREIALADLVRARAALRRATGEPALP